MTTSLSHNNNKQIYLHLKATAIPMAVRREDTMFMLAWNQRIWKKVGGRAQAHTIATNITDEELAALKGGRGDV